MNFSLHSPQIIFVFLNKNKNKITYQIDNEADMKYSAFELILCTRNVKVRLNIKIQLN